MTIVLIHQTQLYFKSMEISYMYMFQYMFKPYQAVCKN